MAAEAQAFKSVDELVAERLLSRGLNRGEFSRRFDKAGLSKCHMFAAREFRKLADEEVASPRIYHLLELERGPESLESLQKIGIRDLDQRVTRGDQVMPYVVHWRQALYGRLCVPAFKTGGVHTVLEDSSGSAVPVVIHHAAAADYPVGMEVAITQPCFMILTRPDKCVGILVDNPASVVDLRSLRVSANTGSEAAASPGCSEYIGPVRIGLGEDEHNNGRRGLFATRDVRKGEVLMRGRPLATGEKKKNKSDMLGMVISGGSMDSVTALIDRLVVNTTQQLVANAVKLVRQDPRSAHQLYSLAVADDPTRRIPSMELFDPSSRTKYDPLQIDVGRIRRTVITNVAGTPDGLYSGLYVLSSFMNHDYDPNCSVCYEGVTQEVRAHADVSFANELTLGYFETKKTSFFRQGKSKGLHFSCSCPRCLFERLLIKTVPSFRDATGPWKSERARAQHTQSMPAVL